MRLVTFQVKNPIGIFTRIGCLSALFKCNVHRVLSLRKDVNNEN